MGNFWIVSLLHSGSDMMFDSGNHPNIFTRWTSSFIPFRLSVICLNTQRFQARSECGGVYWCVRLCHRPEMN